MSFPIQIPREVVFLLSLLTLLFSCSSGEQETPTEPPIPVLQPEGFPPWDESDYPPEPQVRDTLSPEQRAYNDRLDQAFRAKIPTRAWDAIKQFDPEFETWASHDFAEHCGQPWMGDSDPNFPDDRTPEEKASVPWGVMGDFNEDGQQDLALMGHNETQELVLVAMRKGNAFEVQEIQRSNSLSDPQTYGLDYYLEFMENCVISIPNEDYSFPLHGDAFVLVYCDGRPEFLVYLEEGEFAFFPLTEGE